MTTSHAPYRSGSLFALKYHFAERGDGIAMHSHPVSTRTVHNIIVVRGSVEVYGPGKTWRQILRAGDVFDLPDPFGPHEIAALEGGTDTIHFCLHGTPPDYVGATDAELTGENIATLAYPV
jgi:hypothetical protein